MTSSTQFLILKIIHVELSKEFIHLKCNENILTGNCMFKVNNRNTRTWCEIYSKVTIKTPERRRSSVSITNLEHVIVDWDKNANRR